MKPTSIGRIRRSSPARIRWQSHIAAQQTSGLTQATYCREHNLNDKCFSHWKRKLRDEATSGSPLLIPVSVTKTLEEQTSRKGADEPYRLKATLPNGIVVEIVLPSATTLLRMLSQLVQLPC